MKMPTLGQATAFGRHVVSYSMGAITMAAALHVVKDSDASSLTTAVTQISNGVVSIAGGLATIVSVGAGLWAAWSSSPLRQLLAVANNVEVKQVVLSNPATANAVPSDKVIAK